MSLSGSSVNITEMIRVNELLCNIDIYLSDGKKLKAKYVTGRESKIVF